MASQQKPPSNLDAESSVLGSILIDPDAMLRVRQTDLQPEQFYAGANGVIYGAMIGLSRQMQPIDTTTVQGALGAKLDEIGGLDYLIRLVQQTPTSVNVVAYAEQVMQCAKRREIIAVSQDMASVAYAHTGATDELLTDVSGQFFSVVNTNNSRTHLYGTDNAILDYLVAQDDRRERLAADPNGRLQTGHADVDRMIDELEPGYIMIVGAQTSVGKTVFSEGVAEYNAMRGHKVCFYHLELTHQSMLHRRMVRHSGVSMHELRTGYNGPELSTAINRISPWMGNMTYIHCPGWTAERIAADITRERASGNCDLVIIDYLTLINMPRTQGSNDAARIGNAIGVLKVLAEQLEIPMVIPSQTRRTQDGATDVHKDDLRGSGEIEERTNQIIMLNRQGERDDNAETEIINISVEKNSSGPCGECKLVHKKGRFLYLDYADPRYGGDEWEL